MARETILIVDDEEDIIELIKYNLKTEGYVILTAGTGEQAIKTAGKSLPDLIVLDLMLPGIDGLEVTRHLKKNDRTADIPIVMVTAKGEESDVVTGLELGANDYISKPFSPRELTARIRAILRRRRKTGENAASSGIRQVGDMVIDRARHAVTIQGEPLDLTLSEFELLSFLADKKGWVFTRGQIMDAIHGENYAVTERSIDVIIVGLRKKLKTHAACIETVRGVGYRFKESS
jgi:two-component system phosphate regulon response regulator PhoB